MEIIQEWMSFKMDKMFKTRRLNPRSLEISNNKISLRILKDQTKSMDLKLELREH